jgi:hypothetical protein
VERVKNLITISPLILRLSPTRHLEISFYIFLFHINKSELMLAQFTSHVKMLCARQFSTRQTPAYPHQPITYRAYRIVPCIIYFVYKILNAVQMFVDKHRNKSKREYYINSTIFNSSQTSRQGFVEPCV